MKQVTSLMQLKVLSIQKKSVVCYGLPPWSNPKPAAFIMNLQGTVIYRLLKHGMYVYTKGEKNGRQ
jgi:hypothetical protein